MTQAAMYPITEARSRIKELVEEAEHRPVMLVRHSRPAAILISPARYESLLDRISELEDTVAILEHKFAPGETKSWAKVKADLGLST